MTEAEWLACDDANEMLGYVHWGHNSDRRRALFLAACVELLRPYLADSRLAVARVTLEKFADGICTFGDLALACREAGHALECIREDPSEQRWFYAQVALAETVVGALHPESYEHLESVIENCRHAIELFKTNVPEHTTRQWVNNQQAAFVRDIFGNPFRPVSFDPAWRTSTAVAIALGMYESRSFDAMPILANALQDSGCDAEAALSHCRDPQQVHVRGCWVVDLVLGKG